jgi:hypothetical protein
MFGSRWRVMPAVATGDWRAKLIIAAQSCVAFVAVVAVTSMLTLNPFWLLGFTVVQGLLVVGLALYVIVVIFAQRALIEEEFDANEVIFREGELGRHLYVIKSGRVEVLTAGPHGALTRIKELGAGDHFGEMALLGNHPRNATVRTLTRAVLLKMDRGSFAALYTSLPGVQSHFNQVLEARLKELRGANPRG